MQRTSLFVMILICATVLLSPNVSAQYPKGHRVAPGSLDGSVITPKGKPVPGAEIIWQDSDGGVPHVLHSDRQGHFGIVRMRGGLYDLRASKGGIQSDWAHNVLIRAGRSTAVTLRLEPNGSALPPHSK